MAVSHKVVNNLTNFSFALLTKNGQVGLHCEPSWTHNIAAIIQVICISVWEDKEFATHYVNSLSSQTR